MSALREQEWGSSVAPMSASKRQAIGAATRKCRSCPRIIFFARTPKGRMLPFDLDKASEVSITQSGELNFVLSVKRHECVENTEASTFETEEIEGIEIPRSEADVIRESFPDPDLQLLLAAKSWARAECFRRDIPFQEAKNTWDSDLRYLRIRSAVDAALRARGVAHRAGPFGFVREIEEPNR